MCKSSIRHEEILHIVSECQDTEVHKSTIHVAQRYLNSTSNFVLVPDPLLQNGCRLKSLPDVHTRVLKSYRHVQTASGPGSLAFPSWLRIWYRKLVDFSTAA